MTIDIKRIDGTSGGSFDLPDSIFGIEPNIAVMHQAVKMYLANQRQGTHKTKGRSEVAGGGRKPWRQKGRGTARAGSTRSPLWVGGGNVHGPTPHEYRQTMPKKMRQLARRSALSLKAQANEIIVVDDMSFTDSKTRPFADMLRALDAYGKKALVLVREADESMMKSSRNIHRCEVIKATNVSTYDLLNNQVLVIERGSVDLLVDQLANDDGQ
ncbi:MAG: 50S ribosomal protein L4 [bacterium]|nr:50S ribosomal protein L4 [Candidatus Kapabacteria bacterium]